MDSSSLYKRHAVGRGASSESGWMAAAAGGGERRRQLTKVLFNVYFQSSLGVVHVMMSPESTIRELMKAAIGIYMKEKRRPLLASSDPGCYELHYSQFTLESLKPEEKLMELGSRNFFLCTKAAGCVH